MLHHKFKSVRSEDKMILAFKSQPNVLTSSISFAFQVGQTQKAFEHLGNALTYDPTFAKVR